MKNVRLLRKRGGEYHSRVISVNEHNRKLPHKIVRVHSHSRKVKGFIPKRERKIFSALDRQSFETGGYLDLEEGGIENVKLHVGTKSGVEFPFDPDYEVQWHTHPPDKNVVIFPSDEDLKAFKETPQETQIIFHRGNALSMHKLKGFDDVPETTYMHVIKEMDKDLRKNKSTKEVYFKYRPRFMEELGIDLKFHIKGTDIKLETEVV